jgi:hypothetical protein
MQRPRASAPSVEGDLLEEGLELLAFVHPLVEALDIGVRLAQVGVEGDQVEVPLSKNKVSEVRSGHPKVVNNLEGTTHVQVGDGALLVELVLRLITVLAVVIDVPMSERTPTRTHTRTRTTRREGGRRN